MYEHGIKYEIKNKIKIHILILNGQVYLRYINMDIMTMVKGIKYNVHDIRYGMRLYIFFISRNIRYIFNVLKLRLELKWGCLGFWLAKV